MTGLRYLKLANPRPPFSPVEGAAVLDELLEGVPPEEILRRAQVAPAQAGK